MPDSLAPGFLIAVPQLMDGNFHHAVVLVIDHDRNGAFGLVINRPSNIRVSELARSLHLEYSAASEALVLIGGPVQPEQGLVLHRGPADSEESRHLLGSIYACTTPGGLAQLFRRTGLEAVCFAGYSGWGPGQLDSEIENGAWIPAPLDEEMVFTNDRTRIWEKSLRNMGIDPLFLVRGGSVN